MSTGNRSQVDFVRHHMTRSSPVRSTHTQRSLVPLAAVMVFTSGCILTGCILTGEGGPSNPVSVDGWSGRSILCGYRSTQDPLNDLGSGEVLDLGNEPASILSAGRCHDAGDPRSRDGFEATLVPEPEEGQRHFALNTGVDRFEVTLVSVDTSVEPVHLEVEVTVSGEGCAQTADHRGQLMLLIGAPTDATKPTVSLREVPIAC